VTEGSLDGVIEPLQWDSEHFGFPIARVRDPSDPVQIRGAVDAAESLGVRCLTMLAKADWTEAIATAEDLGFRCYDVRADLDRKVESAHGSLAQEGLRLAIDADLPHLEPIAQWRFSATRFAADPHFPRELTRDLYVEWLRRGHRDESRRLVTSDELDGFVVCHLEGAGGVGTIELIAVSASSEGIGLSNRLLRGAEALFAEAGLERAHVVTQGRNLQAQRLYQGYGYRTADVSLWFHRWGPGAVIYSTK